MDRKRGGLHVGNLGAGLKDEEKQRKRYYHPKGNVSSSF
jgi:hypothetical protein